MDHENLKYFQEPHKLNGRQVRWYLKLQDYDFVLRHIPGKINMKADILSRKNHIDTTNDNKDVQMLKDEMWTRRQISAEVKIIRRSQVVEETTILEEIRKNKTKEQEVCKELEKEDSQSFEKDGIVYVDRRVYVPNNQKIKERILQENHEPVDIGYPGQQRMMELIKQNY